jgi:hypothetical protein
MATFGETSTTDEVLAGIDQIPTSSAPLTTPGLPTAVRRRRTSSLQSPSTPGIGTGGFEPPPSIREASKPSWVVIWTQLTCER